VVERAALRAAAGAAGPSVSGSAAAPERNAGCEKTGTAVERRLLEHPRLRARRQATSVAPCSTKDVPQYPLNGTTRKRTGQVASIRSSFERRMTTWWARERTEDTRLLRGPRPLRHDDDARRRLHRHAELQRHQSRLAAVAAKLTRERVLQVLALQDWNRFQS
jgi:hypothetical protein